MFRTSATGARQLVVHEAAEITLSFLVIFFSLTPKTIVLSAFLHGADTITFLAPFLIWFKTLSLELNFPVHSKTISTPYLFHFIFSILVS